jgi:thiamine-phosphate pyrophosphorylase
MIIAVTNRLLCKNNFLNQLEKICQAKPYGIILREKDLTDNEYEILALNCKKICDSYNVSLFINSKINIAEKLNIKNIQLPFTDFIQNQNKLKDFSMIAVSVHSKDEAIKACCVGASFLIAGHIFETDCKKGFVPKGLIFLKEAVNSVNIPVFAIGGITQLKVKDVTKVKAKGICVMSQLMTCPNPKDIILEYKKIFVTFCLESKK